MKKLNLSLLILLLSISIIGFTGCKDPEPAHEHTFSDVWSSDATYHYKWSTRGHDVVNEKAKHTFGDWKVTKEPTEEAEGRKERTCTVCGYKAPEVIAKLDHTHKFSDDWTSDDIYHWHVATCEHTTEVSDKAEHTFGNWTTTKAATEEAEGTRERSCTVCGYTATEAIEKLAHTHKFATDWTKDETPHWYVATCEHTDEKSGFAEHSFGVWKVVQEPTDTQAGRNERTCKYCAYVVDSVVLQPAPEGFVFVKGATVTGALPAWLDESADSDYKGVFIKGRTVTLSDFYMGKYEITQEEYASVMEGQKVTVNGTEYALESNASVRWTLFNGDVQEKRPVEGVTWYDAVWYCNALSTKEGLTPAYDIVVTQVEQISGTTDYYIYEATVTLNTNATGYRLPTEAEWEYAARGGDPTKDDWNYVFSGADTAKGVSYDSDKNAGLDSVGWYKYNSINGTTGDTEPSDGEQGNGTHQVGKKAPNRLGLYDMSGNVYEWCNDWDGTITTTTPAYGATSGSIRVCRGGRWWGYADDASVSYRNYWAPGVLDSTIGFRVVRSFPSTTE